jgi:hypothetical protein
MGKKKHGAKAASADLTEDEMLEQAIAENKAVADAAADAAASGIRPLTKMEVISKLDQVMVLNIVAVVNGAKQIVPGSDGELCWYADVIDAKAALSALQAKMPTLPGHSLGLDFTPFGRAYSLSEGWVSPRQLQGDAPPMRLQPSSQVLEACGADGVKTLQSQLPAQLRKHNRRQGAFPLFFLEELQSERVMPFFFTRDDLVACWVSSGKPFEELPPQLSAIDLRALIARALTEPRAWLERLHIVPSQGLVDLMQMVDGLSDQLEQLSKLAAKATGEAIAEANAAHVAAVASGEEPPPLE